MGPLTIDQLVVRVGLGVGPVALALAELGDGGWVSQTNGRWRQLGPTQNPGGHDVVADSTAGPL